MGSSSEEDYSVPPQQPVPEGNVSPGVGLQDYRPSFGPSFLPKDPRAMATGLTPAMFAQPRGGDGQPPMSAPLPSAQPGMPPGPGAPPGAGGPPEDPRAKLAALLALIGQGKRGDGGYTTSGSAGVMGGPSSARGQGLV